MGAIFWNNWYAISDRREMAKVYILGPSDEGGPV
jgi:hypothetical protein